MPLQHTYIRLRTILAGIYNESIGARRIVDDAGLNSSKIHFDTAAINTWHAILTEAKKSNRLDTLIDVVRAEYPNNQELIDACEDYRKILNNAQNATKISQLQPYFAHPYPLQVNFTGRSTERQMLTDWLINDQRPLLALVAMGGMGKSALSWYWLQNDVTDESLDGILWWSFYEREASFSKFLEEALIYISNKTVDLTKLPSNYDKFRALVDLVQKNRLLIVLDGFERELHAYASSNAVYQRDEAVDTTADVRACIDPNASRLLHYLAAGPTRSKVLITTRLMVHDLEDRVGDPLAGCRKEELKSLHPDDAIRFMHSQGVNKGTRTKILAACNYYGFHPLSLRLLAGLIVKDKRNPGDIISAPRYDVHNSLVANQHHILEVAYNELEDAVRVLLSKMAAFRNPVNYDALIIFNQFDNEKEFDKALDELLERGLVLFDRQHNRYDLHPIVRAYGYDRLSDPAGTHARLRNYFETIPTPDDSQVQTIDDIEMVIELYHHSICSGFLGSAIKLLESRLLDNLYFRLAAYPKYAELCKEFLDTAKNSKQVKLSEILKIQNRLGVANQKMGLLRLALNDLRQVNQLTQEDVRSTLRYRTSNNIAQIEVELGELQHAKDNFRNAITLAKTEGDTIEVGRSLQEFARLEIITGEYESSTNTLAEVNKVQPATRHNRSFAYLALSYLRLGDLQKSYAALMQAEKLALGFARNQVWVNWLQGEHALLDNRLSESDSYLSTALLSCRRVNLSELESDILLGFSRLRFTQARQLRNELSRLDESRTYIEEAHSIATRYGYRLKQADISNFLAELELNAGNIYAAQRHASTAKELAWCDGPPNSYIYALNKAEMLLQIIREHS